LQSTLRPLFCTNINPYDKFTLDMDSQHDLDRSAPPSPASLSPVTPTRDHWGMSLG
jgi:hypothetical protein